MALRRTPLRRTRSRRSGKAFRRSDVSEVEWREEVLQRDRWQCKSCGLRDMSGRQLSAHHVIFKSRCVDRYVTDRRNGLTLCNGWGNACHQKLHGGVLKLRRRMLPPEVITCLQEQGMSWDDDGTPWGPCRRYFAQEANSG